MGKICRSGLRLLTVAGLAIGVAGCSAQYSNHGYIPPQEELDLTQEEVEGIEESGADFAGSEFETSGPEVTEETIDVVEVPEPVEEFTAEASRD